MKERSAFKSPEGKAAILRSYDLLLEHWPGAHERLHLDTRYGSTFVVACGPKDAPPVILLHGSWMNSAMWVGAATQYATHHRVYAVDMPGEPGRSDERQLSLATDDYAQWLHDVFDALKIPRARLVSISLGAWLATKFAVTFPEKVEKLALLCPAGIGPQRLSFLLKSLPLMLLGDRGMELSLRKVNGSQDVPDVIMEFMKLVGKNYNYRREPVPMFSDSELQRLTMPTILFVGEKDVMFYSEETAARPGRLLPHAKINIIPGAGHTLINLDDKIIEFLGSRP